MGTNAAAWPSFGQTPTDAKSGARMILPHEQRARDIIELQQAADRKAKQVEEERREMERKAQEARNDEWQPRRFSMNTGPGPQFSRGGRFEPRQASSHAERLAWARSAVERRNAAELSSQRRPNTDPAIFRGIRRTGTASHILGEPVLSNEPKYSSQETPQWGQLRQRRQDSPLSPPQAPISKDNPFLAGRARREAEASTIGYVPLGGSAVHQESLRVTRPGIEAQALSLREREVTFRPEVGSSFKNASLDTESKQRLDHRTALSEDTARQPRERRKETKRAEPILREGKASKRFEVESYNDFPKGKSRDKAKRRDKFRDDDEEADPENARENALRKAEERKRRKEEKAAKKAAEPTPVLLPEYISVSNLARALKIRVESFVEKMGELGYEEVTGDHILNSEDAGLIAMEYNYEAIIDRSESEDLRAREPVEDSSILPQRPPVVTIMGHVDHGKTTLLDWLRKSSVAATEHGGITQHIGAFSVPMPGGKIITFLDTPGHAAFLSMRQRGANVTDIVILVVAADDSVKPQTIEAINHAKSAKVPIIVAINKIDKEDVNIERVKQDLARHGVDVEDFGGDVQAIGVSGKTGQGMDELEEAVVTLSEILDMRAETDGLAEGWVLEASIKSMGKVATVLVRRGTMRPGDFIVAGQTWARIRCLRNEAGVEIEEAGPGTPVEIDGWREQPLAGDEVLQAPDEAKAKSVIEYRLEKAERDKLALDMEAINETRTVEKEKRDREKEEAAKIAEAAESGQELAPEAQKEIVDAGPKQVYFIVKGDVSGSVEAVIDQVSALGNKEVQPHVLRSGVGSISEFDIEHAAAAKGHVINFNTNIDPQITRLAAASKVSILDHSIIYKLVDEVKAELSKHLKPLVTQRVLGEAEIAQIFTINVKGRQQKSIAGCKVRNGTVARNSKVRVLRKNQKVFDGMSLLCSFNSCYVV